MSALLWNGPPRRLLMMARDHDVMLLTSPPLLDELRDVLERRKFAARLQAASLSPIDLVRGYAALAYSVRPDAVSGIAPDSDDDIVIGTALGGRAALLVTGDHGLQSVGRVDTVRIVDTGNALLLIGQEA
ncbi:putative toxin-antitoxin system toxin component, PIN family [Sandaracinobacteroides saxicola]|uniref:putative toxin-antitoxin system toxin component, PIN family n=1 Tax=Sandaracinobacteroides saxicola TaxID=2759707 RepID=UPI001FB0FC12|nr:putative toxin-antitoxin system toxin component, PIN family [Sandaracinobacteroides saxicola]